MGRNKYMVLVLLALVFVAPSITAYIFFAHPQWLGKKTTNKGEFVHPAVLLPALKGSKPVWQLVYWEAEHCEDNCRMQLDKLARIRLALGRRLYEVDESLVLREAAQPLPEELVKTLAEQQISVLRLTADQQREIGSILNQSTVFIADPNHFLILSYSVTAPSADIFHDIKQLLNTTEKGR